MTKSKINTRMKPAPPAGAYNRGVRRIIRRLDKYGLKHYRKIARRKICIDLTVRKCLLKGTILEHHFRLLAQCILLGVEPLIWMYRAVERPENIDANGSKQPHKHRSKRSKRTAIDKGKTRKKKRKKAI